MGVILYEGTTGARPFADKSGNFVTMAMAICNGDFPPPRDYKPDLPEAFERVILRAMSLRADDRFFSMRQLGAALLPFASDRARIIWSPTFAAEAGEADARDDQAPNETQVLRGASGLTPIVTGPISVSSPVPYSMTGPVAPAHGWPPSSVRPYPVQPSQSPPSFTGVPSAMPAPLHTGSGHYVHGVPVHDRTPSFGAGINSSIRPPPAKKSSVPVVAAAVLAVVGIGLIGLVLSRSSARQAGLAGDDSVTAAGGATTFAVDVQATPEAAAIELDGVPVGSGRLTRQFPRDAQKHVLRISAPGYETVLLEFDGARPPPGIVALRATSAGIASSTLAGKNAPAAVGARPPVAAGPAVVPSNARPAGNPPNVANAPNAPNAKGKPDRPRTDNIDPWE
jgi:hypothetical protein